MGRGQVDSILEGEGGTGSWVMIVVRTQVPLDEGTRKVPTFIGYLPCAKWFYVCEIWSSQQSCGETQAPTPYSHFISRGSQVNQRSLLKLILNTDLPGPPPPSQSRQELYQELGTPRRLAILL